MKRPNRLPLYIGLALAAAGWAAVLLGWWQAGRQDLETGQIPYVLSGGFGGWGLLAMGALGVLIDFVRQAEWRAHRHLRDVQVTLEKLGDALERTAKPRSTPSPDGKPAAESRPRTRSARSRSRRPR